MKIVFRHLIVLAFALTAFASCSDDRKRDEPAWTPRNEVAKATPKLGYTVVNKYPHDVNAFTEGLFFHNGKLIESTGSPENLPQTRSLFGVVDLGTGRIDVKAELDRNTYFGEGVVIHGDKLYQLTWRNQTGFIYDAGSFRRIGQFSYPNREGWGLTTDGKSLIMSDGTFNLTYLNPASLAVEKVLPVTREGFGLDHLNELEWVDGYIYANVWMTNRIVKIDPATGVVVAECDLSELAQEAAKTNPGLSEMNGIAYNAETKQLLVTGKMWPHYYEIKFSNGR
jgi:glutaminyl-peptide cyclotransferase